MKLSSLLKTRSLLVLLVLTIGSQVWALGPCYQHSGQLEGCMSNCAIIGPAPTLPCAGGPWSLANLAAMGANAAWPCDKKIVSHWVPKNYSILGNMSTGLTATGNVVYVCESVKKCNKITFAAPAITISCVSFLTTCTTKTVFTATGAPCVKTPPTGGTGTGPGGGKDTDKK